MFNISQFLEKFRVIGEASVLSKEIVMKAIAESGVSLEPAAVTLRGDTIHVHAHPLIKNQLFLKKKYILEALKLNPKTERIADLR